MAKVPLKCHCGAVQGVVHNVSPRSGTRLVCYCSDCQAFAHYLGRAKDVLDNCGGTDIFQLTPSQVEITQGAEQLRCVRLSDRGTHRWYTNCCKTPIGNTVSAKLPFVGLIHSFFDIEEGNTLDKNLGLARFHINGKDAKGVPDVEKLYPAFPSRLMSRIMRKLFIAKLRRRCRPTPFYDDAGKPVASPVMVSSE